MLNFREYIKYKIVKQMSIKSWFDKLVFIHSLVTLLLLSAEFLYKLKLIKILMFISINTYIIRNTIGKHS